MSRSQCKYDALIRKLFFNNFDESRRTSGFRRADIQQTAADVGVYPPQDEEDLA